MRPQWSPSTEDGTTGHAQHAGDRSTCAAMEPVHGGRDDLNGDDLAPLHEIAAMEPVHGGRDDSDDLLDGLASADAAMEPVHGGRDDLIL